MAKPPKIFQPLIATGNALRSGNVVFRTGAGLWSRDVKRAFVAETPQAADDLQTAASADNAANLVVDPALIPAIRDGDAVVPVALRERIRAQGGPTMALPVDAPASPGAHDAWHAALHI